MFCFTAVSWVNVGFPSFQKGFYKKVAIVDVLTFFSNYAELNFTKNQDHINYSLCLSMLILNKTFANIQRYFTEKKFNEIKISLDKQCTSYI